MKRLAVIVILFLLTPISVSAHPGNTDSSGCHTCRTNCIEKWGLQYGEYHCHNAKTAPVEVTRAIEPIIVPSIPKPTLKPIIKTPNPTVKPTIKPTEVPTIAPTETPTIEPTMSPSPSYTPIPATRTSGITKIWKLFLMFLK